MVRIREYVCRRRTIRKPAGRRFFRFCFDREGWRKKKKKKSEKEEHHHHHHRLTEEARCVSRGRKAVSWWPAVESACWNDDDDDDDDTLGQGKASVARAEWKRIEPSVVGVDHGERMVEAKSGLSRARRAICGGPFVNPLTKANNLPWHVWFHPPSPPLSPIKSVTCWPRPPLPPPSSPAVPLHAPPKLHGKTFSLVELAAISYRVADSGEQCVYVCVCICIYMYIYVCLPVCLLAHFFFPSFLPSLLSLSKLIFFCPSKETRETSG